MNGYATEKLATIRQQELHAEANRFRLAKEAQNGSRGTAIAARRPRNAFRTAVSTIASRLAALRHAPAANPLTSRE